MVPVMFFAYEGGWVGGARFHWEHEDVPFSPEEYPGELKMTSISGLLVKGIGCLL